MTELKTLKDLVCCPPLMKEELKAEAVKWVKEIERIDRKNIKAWGVFVTFFNLTEEEIKGE